MPKYECPECESVLKRDEEVPAGKKLRCPKCEAVFAPSAGKSSRKGPPEKPSKGGKAPPPPAPPPEKKKPADDDDEEAGGSYAVITEKKEEEDDRPQIEFGSLRDRYAKSKIGPAMAMTVTPSNWLLRLGLVTCVFAVAYFIYALFPIVFCEVMPIRPFIRPRVNLMIHATLMFIFGGIMCQGASKMHELTSYTWSIVGSIMALLIYIPTSILVALVIIVIFGPMGMILAVLVGLLALVGLWCLVVLMNSKVRDGFGERYEESQAKIKPV